VLVVAPLTLDVLPDEESVCNSCDALGERLLFSLRLSILLYRLDVLESDVSEFKRVLIVVSAGDSDVPAEESVRTSCDALGESAA